MISGEYNDEKYSYIQILLSGSNVFFGLPVLPRNDPNFTKSFLMGFSKHQL